MGSVFAKLFARSKGRDTRVLMLGLDSAGKTTILCIFILSVLCYPSLCFCLLLFFLSFPPFSPPPFFVKILLFLTPLTLQSSNAFIESLFLLISFYTYLLLSIFYYLSFPSQPLHPLAQCLPSLFRIPPHLLVSLLSSGTKFEDPSLLIVVSLPFYCSFWILWSVLFFFVVYKFFLVSFLL